MHLRCRRGRSAKLFDDGPGSPSQASRRSESALPTTSKARDWQFVEWDGLTGEPRVLNLESDGGRVQVPRWGAQNAAANSLCQVVGSLTERFHTLLVSG